MRILYYDCFCGISGDMNLGALLDLGVDLNYLKAELQKLSIEEEYEIQVTHGMKMGISGTKVDVILASEKHEKADPTSHQHSHEHTHTGGNQAVHEHIHTGGNQAVHEHTHTGMNQAVHEHTHTGTNQAVHQHRTYAMIRDKISQSNLSDYVKACSIEIFYLIAQAEGKVHNKPAEEVHFHEVGATDSIIDIVGAAICLEALHVDKVFASSVQVGGGFVKCAHGKMPVPAPATAAILQGVPTKYGIVPFETTTPTGAAILKATVSEFMDQPTMKIHSIGYGLGTKEFEIPNVTRVFLGEMEESKEINAQSLQDVTRETQYIIETNIDDMSGELYGFVEQKLFAAGALDVFKTPIMMKKGRPAITLSVLVPEHLRQTVINILFRETTAAGVRERAVEKYMLRREFEVIATRFGAITMKHLFLEGKLLKSKAEYEDCARVAQAYQVPLATVFAEVAHVLHQGSPQQEYESVKVERDFLQEEQDFPQEEQEFQKLKDYLKPLGSIAVAFSGGVDSTFLLYAAKEAVGDNAVAITIDSPYIPRFEIEESRSLAQKIGVKHLIIQADIDESIQDNPTNRCYLCKRVIFSRILEEAKKLGCHTVVDGSNFDDTKDYRPGLMALKELDIKSPLMDCQWTKELIRIVSKQKGLETHDKPAYACLLTRIPYNVAITNEELVRIEKAETFMMQLGFRAVRVRSHHDIARIEVAKIDRSRLFDEALLDQISKEIKSYGYTYVAIETSGYEMGSLNKQM
jgi:uncharacterized protein (TIGR00299 family) protein/uncharacterized protein (TIGR00268 family)